MKVFEVLNQLPREEIVDIITEMVVLLAVISGVIFIWRIYLATLKKIWILPCISMLLFLISVVLDFVDEFIEYESFDLVQSIFKAVGLSLFCLSYVWISRHLIRVANTDPLTGLYNKRFLEEHVNKVIKSCRETDGDNPCFVLVFLDIDRFKPINDELGHIAGDEALKLIAQKLQEQIRTGDIITRFGGDEFVIVLCHSSKEEAETIINRLNLAIAQLELPGEFSLTVSTGVANYPGNGESIDQLIEFASGKMYESRSVRNRNGQGELMQKGQKA